MNNTLETAIKNKIAIEMIDYLGNDSIEDLPYNIEYQIGYKELLKDEETLEEIRLGYIEYGFSDNDMIGWINEDLKKEGHSIRFAQSMTIATTIVFEKYFNDEFVCNPFTIEQFKKALKILEVDVFDVLEMKYCFNM